MEFEESFALRVTLDETLDDLMAVALGVEFAADVYPPMVGGWCGSFKNQLVEVGVVHQPDEPSFEFIKVWHVDVGSLSLQMLAVLHATYCGIQLWATIATTDDDGYRPPLIPLRWGR